MISINLRKHECLNINYQAALKLEGCYGYQPSSQTRYIMKSQILKDSFKIKINAQINPHETFILLCIQAHLFACKYSDPLNMYHCRSSIDASDYRLQCHVLYLTYIALYLYFSFPYKLCDIH